MKGKNLNNLVKTIDALKVSVVPMVKEFAIVDSAHVSMIEIRALDGAPIFGTESEFFVDLDDFLKLPDAEDFCADVDDYKYILENADYRYSYNLVDEGYDKPKVPKIENLHVVTVPSKKIQDAVKTLKGIKDYAIIESDGYVLTMTAKTDTKEVQRTLGECDEAFSVMLPFDYVERISKVLTGDVKMELDTDYPTIWTWTDGCYEYRYLLAPRVERS